MLVTTEGLWDDWETALGGLGALLWETRDREGWILPDGSSSPGALPRPPVDTADELGQPEYVPYYDADAGMTVMVPLGHGDPVPPSPTKKKKAKTVAIRSPSSSASYRMATSARRGGVSTGVVVLGLGALGVAGWLLLRNNSKTEKGRRR